ncbi:MAG: FtsW/RodA/SpoVE family cell cycle protein [Lachnospiraceae bacterium]|nr:FtsW/RodA/SpoVE family cell cycle protein [Lachnospiraceae bacterium]
MNVLTQLSRYFFIILIAFFTLEDYLYFGKRSEEARMRLIRRQMLITHMLMASGFLLLFLHLRDIGFLLLSATVIIYFMITLSLYRSLYPNASMLLVNNMLMLLGIGFLMIARLSLDKAFMQFVIAASATIIAFLVPVLIRKMKFLPRLTWLYAILGIGALLGVLALAAVSGGAKLSIEIGGFTLQLSELVKLTLVFFMAAQMAADNSFRSAALTAAVAAVHVFILVLSTDLGTALVFFTACIVVVFVATGKLRYPLTGLLGGSAAAVLAYFAFGHVRARVVAWRDPFAVYETSGYQIVQGLFGIGAGGWLGSGLGQGSPGMIPVASKDAIFAAICEELGGIFAICLLLICMSTFLLIVSISMRIHNTFYKLVAIGLGTEYAIQVFLTVGGVMKFIPLTGITLPLVSYGGSSVMSTILMIAIVEGLYILREDEGEYEKKMVRMSAREKVRQEEARNG